MLKDLAHLQTSKKRQELKLGTTKEKPTFPPSDFSGDNILSYTIYFVLQTLEWSEWFKGFEHDVEWFTKLQTLHSVAELAEIQIIDRYDSVQGRIK